VARGNNQAFLETQPTTVVVVAVPAVAFKVPAALVVAVLVTLLPEHTV